MNDCERLVEDATPVDPKTPSPFGALARQIRLLKGLSQEEVSARGNMAKGHLSMVETGSRGWRPSREMVLRVAKGLDATSAEREALLEAAGFPVTLRTSEQRSGFVAFVQSDPDLTDKEKQVIIATYLALRNGS